MSVVTVADPMCSVENRIARWLRAEGYATADCTGAATTHVDNDSVGILLPDGPPQSFMARLFRCRRRRWHPATVWTNNYARGATPRRWVLETHNGTRWLEFGWSLAEKLSAEFRVDVHVVCGDRNSPGCYAHDEESFAMDCFDC